MASRDELKQMLGKPIIMGPNTYLHFYNGGKLRAEFMGEPDPKDDFRSEEWMFSTNRAVTPGRKNPLDKGMSRFALPSGEIVLLADLLREFPEETLGPAHFQKHGSSLGILVKIFDVGADAHIPVHWHPTPEFASKHLASPYGKNEAWIVVGVRDNARAWIGWKEDVSKEDFTKWADAQDVETMRAHMHEIGNLKVGDVIVLSASEVHAIEGICVLEPQEPTDWNILAEWGGEFPFEREDALLGLDWDTALESLNLKAMPESFLNNDVLRKPTSILETGFGVVQRLTPKNFDPYFRVFRSEVRVGLEIGMPVGSRPTFHCLTITAGQGTISGNFGEIRIKQGMSLFVPCSIPSYQLSTSNETPLEVVTCLPSKLA